MSILQEAHGLIINGGAFHTQNTYQYGSTGIDILYDASTPEAAIDAEERSYAPSCYPGTRDQYIDDITEWVAAGSSDYIQPIYWMKGPAGVGKSAIAQTCATKLKDAGHLAAAFFFSINGRRKDHTRFVPSLAYQLLTIYHDYREIINRKIAMDRTLVKKTMASQFQSLIVEPLQELKAQGKEVQRRAIFIDGLDECENQDAQVEIIQLIGSSIRTGSTPFRWVIFSREEPHILSAFADLNISSRCYSVSLPISRNADEEIELYLRAGFKNILQRRGLFRLSSSWPAKEDIWKLVDAAAGLFAHSAIVIRFIDRYSFSGFEESLKAVLASVETPSIEAPSLYTELDKIYTLILQRVPADMLPTTLLFFNYMTIFAFDDQSWSIAFACNRLGISENIFRIICYHMQAVLVVQDPLRFTTEALALERSYFDQDSTSKPSFSFDHQLWEVHGTVDFNHKSFYDFLSDPSRSTIFCVATPAAREQLFNHCVRQHSHYTSSYAIQDSKLVLAPQAASSSVSLSWPQGSEFVDSYLKYQSLFGIGPVLLHDYAYFGQFLQDVSTSSLRQLAELDFRKSLIADKMMDGVGVRLGASVVGYQAVGRIMRTDSSAFTCIDKDKYDVFDPVVFLRRVEKLEKAQVIRPYNSHLGSSRAASLLHTFSRQKPHGRRFGQYKMGHGEKSVVWYWEFDTVERYFHEFQTVNFAEAMAYYKAKKLEMWVWKDEIHITGYREEGICRGQ